MEPPAPAQLQPPLEAERAMMKRLDYKKDFKYLYLPSAKTPCIVDVPEMKFLMIDGSGDPNTSSAYREALEALYGVAYTLKFMLKKYKVGVEYGVPPLEGLWWTEDMSPFNPESKDLWKWTSMIMQPDFVTQDHVRETFDLLGKRKTVPALSKTRLDSFHEGLSAQIMHIGPYSAEGPTIQRLHDFIKNTGHELAGKHHEIYLGDPRRTAPEKLRTVIRQSMRRVLGT